MNQKPTRHTISHICGLLAEARELQRQSKPVARIWDEVCELPTSSFVAASLVFYLQWDIESAIRFARGMTVEDAYYHLQAFKKIIHSKTAPEE